MSELALDDWLFHAGSMNNFARIAQDPEWIVHRFDASSNRFQFVHAPLSTIQAQTFLADLKPLSVDHSIWVDAAELGRHEFPTVPVHFIFHTAFCRSTLLVSALNIPSASFGLSEPGVLNDLARAGICTPELIKPVLKLLARPLAGAKTIVIKPSNVANNLISPLLQANENSRGILLSGSLSEFLHSVNKKGLGGRTWVRRLYRYVGRYAPLDLGLQGDAEIELTDLQVAALAWFLQQRHFAILLRSPVRDRLATVDSTDLLDDREQTLSSVSRFFDLHVDKERISEVANGIVFRNHAKLGGNYREVLARQSESARSSIIDEEIEIIGRWVEAIVNQTGLSLPVRKPLERD
ncbi:MAG: hypothetical protein CL951_00025 [Erythrobacteraceae bacterium]|mgnify:FL=1|nr:hypothetical protein [Erythrobacteraceae bacterium]